MDVAVVDVLVEIRPALAGKVVVDFTNPLRPGYSGPATEGTSAAVEIQARIPSTPVSRPWRVLETPACLRISLHLRHGWSWKSGWKPVGPEGEAS